MRKNRTPYRTLWSRTRYGYDRVEQTAIGPQLKGRLTFDASNVNRFMVDMMVVSTCPSNAIASPSVASVDFTGVECVIFIWPFEKPSLCEAQ